MLVAVTPVSLMMSLLLVEMVEWGSSLCCATKKAGAEEFYYLRENLFLEISFGEESENICGLYRACLCHIQLSYCLNKCSQSMSILSNSRR